MSGLFGLVVKAYWHPSLRSGKSKLLPGSRPFACGLHGHRGESFGDLAVGVAERLLKERGL